MTEIDAKGLFESISAGKQLLLIDVRQPEELCYGTITGSFNFPLSDIPKRIDELEQLIGEQSSLTDVIVICRVGGRSQQVIQLLESRGSRQLVNLVGGTQKYSEFDERIKKY